MKKIALLLLLIGIVLIVVFIRPKRLFQPKIQPSTKINNIKPVITEGDQLPWLHTDGKYIKDSNGNTVILHGLNHENYAFNNPAQQFANGRYLELTEADYQKMASLGFNVVRLGLAWQNIEPIEGSYDINYFANYIDKNIALAKKYDIRIVLSFMQWGWSPHFNAVLAGAHGFPSWLFDQYPQTETGRTQSQKDFLIGKGPNGTVADANNPSMQDRMIKAWKYIAERYKDDSTVIAYDLFNEPPGGGLGEDTAMDSYLLPFYRRLIDEIKTIDSNHIFIYEPIGGKWFLAPRLLAIPNVIFSTHIYVQDNEATKIVRIPPGYTGDITILKNQISEYLNLPTEKPSKNWEVPIYLGEFGPAPRKFYFNRYRWVSDLVDVFNENRIYYWSAYSYCRLGPNATNGCEYSIINPDGTENKEYADVLDEPYPRVSSVSPLEYLFDRNNKQFKVIFEGTGSVETKIYVPSRYYPDGFLVNSNAIQWSKDWDESSRVLTIQATLKGPIEITIDPK